MISYRADVKKPSTKAGLIHKPAARSREEIARGSCPSVGVERLGLVQCNLIQLPSVAVFPDLWRFWMGRNRLFLTAHIGDNDMADAVIEYVEIDRHYRPEGLRFILTVEGATTQDIQRGIYAATRVFYDADVSPYAAGCAVFYYEAQDDDFPVSAEHLEWVAKWNEAINAAVSAACANMPLGSKVTYLFGQTWDGAPDTKFTNCAGGWHTVSAM